MGSSYLFGKSIRMQEKRSMHQAVVFDEFDQWFLDTFKMDSLPMNGVAERRLYLRKRMRELGFNQSEPLHLQQLQRLEQLHPPEQLEQASILVSAIDYRNVQVLPNSIAYCDIPYKGTGKYQSGDFDHDALRVGHGTIFSCFYFRIQN